MRTIFLRIILFCGILVSASQAQAQGSAEYWRQQTVQHIISYLQVAGKDLVIATGRAGPVRPNGDRVVLRLVLDRSGRILSVNVIKPSGYPRLDRLAQQLVKQAGPLPPYPVSGPGQLTVQLPVIFHGSGRGRGEFFERGR